MKVGPTLYIDNFKRNTYRNNNTLLNKPLKTTVKCKYCPFSHQTYLNTEPPKNNFNIENTNEKNQLEPTFDIFTDYKFIKACNPNINPTNNNCNEINSNICSGFDINSFKLSNLSIGKYNKIKALNINSDRNPINHDSIKIEKQSFINNKSGLKFGDSISPPNVNANKNFTNFKPNEIRKSMDKKRNLSQRILGNQNGYFFDYKNDNYNEIRNKCKMNENSQASFPNLQMNSQQEKGNSKLIGLNNQINLINNNKNNIISKTIGDNFTSQESKRYSNTNNNMSSEEKLIYFLKKENEELKNVNALNGQIINSLFYFVNQISLQHTPNKKSFDYSYYLNHLKDLTPDLNYLYNQINFSDNNKREINNMTYNPNKIENINKFGEILNKKFSFGKEDDLNDNNKNIKNENIRKDEINSNNRYKNIYNDDNQKNINILGCNIKKAENIGNYKNNNAPFNLTYNNLSPQENEIIKSLNNIIYK